MRLVRFSYVDLAYAYVLYYVPFLVALNSFLKLFLISAKLTCG
jgi:hypothetical protein